jgi:alkanesulfonate monooxygenase SsuD/methylene tetrahydromethanopterin reductase-like flavin-dependent oxidoreductase (luciferase family)
VRFGFAIPAYGPGADGTRVRDLLQAGEELGYWSAWFPDHIAVPDYATEVNLRPPFLEPLATCAWGLGITARLVLGTDVLVAPYRHPLVVRAMAGTLGKLAGDRLVLAVGIGYLRGEFDVLGAGPYEERADRTETFLRAQRSATDGFAMIEPLSPVPLWVGGNSRAAEVRAARLGDGWHPLWMSDSEYADARNRIIAIRTQVDRSGPFDFSYSCSATRLLDRDPGRYGVPPERAAVGSEFRYAPAVWVDDAHRPRFVGTADQLVADLRRLEVAGVDHVTLRLGGEVEDLTRFATEVLSAFPP